MLFLFGVGYAGYWIAHNAILPLVSAVVKYLASQADAAQKTASTVATIATIEAEIRGSVTDLSRMHTNPDSPFSTVRTNEALHLIAIAVKHVAKDLGVNIESLVEELSETLAKQEGSLVSTTRE